MKQTILLVVVLSSCCSKASKHVAGENFHKFPMKTLIVDKGNAYRLIRDNLYHDKYGNLYLKTTDVSSADNGDPDKNWEATKLRWISEVYYDSVQSYKSTAKLKNRIDTATFRLDYTDFEQGADFYKDKNHTYFHKWMADGGTISISD